MRNRLFTKAFGLPLTLLGLALAVAGCEQTAKPPQTKSAFVLPEAATVSDFSLSHVELGNYDIDDTRGKWSLLFFGYTRCPDVCPTELFMLSEMMRALEQDPAAVSQSPQVVFVSLDPERDSLQHLQQYAGFYHPDFIGVTSEQATIDRLCQSLGVFYERVYYKDGKALELEPSMPIPEDLSDSYLINHSASILLINPAGKLHAVFAPPHDPQTIISDLAAIQAGWRS